MSTLSGLGIHHGAASRDLDCRAAGTGLGRKPGGRDGGWSKPAGYYEQASGDGGAGNRIGPFKGRATAVGATAGYTFTAAGTPVSTLLKVLREVDVENRPEGTIGLFTVACPLGHHGPPPAPQPIRARY
jgi:hypothetical protein